MKFLIAFLFSMLAFQVSAKSFSKNAAREIVLETYQDGNKLKSNISRAKNQTDLYDAIVGGGFDSFDWQSLESVPGTFVYTLTGPSAWSMTQYCENEGERYRCHHIVKFTPETVGVSFASFTIRCPTCSDSTVVADWDFIGIGIEDLEEPECKPQSPILGSIIRPGDRTVSEAISIGGTNFEFYHSSQFSPVFVSGFPTTGRINSFNPEGWSISVVHHYKSASEDLFLATGEKLKRKAFASQNGLKLVVNGEEIFVFDSNGRHIQTKSGLTGYVKYNFDYNSQGKLVKITDSFQLETLFNRDLAGNLLSVTAPFGQTTSVSLDEIGLISAVTNANLETYQIEYYPDTGLITKFTKPGGNYSELEYTGSARLESDAGNGGNLTRFETDYDQATGEFTKYFTALNRMTVARSRRINGIYTNETVTPAGFVTQYQEGTDKSQISSNLFETSSVLTKPDERFGNSFERLWKTTETIQDKIKTTTISKIVDLNDPSDPFSYNTISTTTNVNGIESTNVFTKSTKRSVSIDPMGVQSIVEIDQYERPILIQHAADTPTSIIYDQQGRVQQTTQGGSNTVTYFYGSNGEIESVKNILNQETQYEYDPADRVTKTIFPDGRFTLYSYNADRLISSITPPGRSAHNFTINAFDLTESYEPPLLPAINSTQTEYSYNLDKQLTKILRPDLKEVNYVYNDTSGLLEQIDLGSGEYQNYTYLPATENIQTVVSPSGVESSLTYFGQNTIQSEQQTINGSSSSVHFSFDNFFRDTQRVISYNNSDIGNLTTNYRPDNQPSSIGNLALVYETISGRLQQTTLAKISDVRAYDSFGNLASYKARYNPGIKCGNGPDGCPRELYSYTLTRDQLQRIVTKVEKVQGSVTTYEYSYDSSGRLAGVTKNGAVESSYVYDSNGNRISGTQNGIPFTATFDSQDRLLTYSSGSNPVLEFEYNANGELIQSKKGTQITAFDSDSLGRLKSVTLPDSRLIDYALDWQGRRVQKTLAGSPQVRSIFEDTYRLAAEVNLQGPGIKEYVFATNVNSADYMKIGAVLYRIIKDHLGSPRLVVNASNGQVVQKMDYNEWGQVTVDSNPGFQAFGYAGGIYDPDTKLVKFGARDYDGGIGRWLSKDPIGFDGGDTNLYGYVLNDPINYFDFKGLDATNWGNTSGGRSPVFDGPTNGNWGGKNWGGGLGPNQSGPPAPATDSADLCYQGHDNCWDNCKGNTSCMKSCDKKLVDDLKKLPGNSKKWPLPPKKGTEKDSEIFRKGAILYF